MGSPHLHTSLVIGFAAGALSAALGCLLIFSIHLCVLRLRRHRRGRSRSQPQPPSLEESAPDLESAAAEIPGIPVAVYKSGNGDTDADAAGAAREGDTSCPVCLAEYEGGEEVRVLPQCQHMFHRECIDRWLVGGSQFTCPVCRGHVL